MKHIIREIDLSKLTGDPLKGDAKLVYDFFEELFNNLQIGTLEEFSDVIFFHKNGDYYMEQHIETGKLWCKYERVWRFFEDRIGLNYQETSDIIKYGVEDKLNRKVESPNSTYTQLGNSVEDQLKRKVESPRYYRGINVFEVEEQLNRKVESPAWKKGVQRVKTN
jgi:hypothetical protein